MLHPEEQALILGDNDTKLPAPADSFSRSAKDAWIALFVDHAARFHPDIYDTKVLETEGYPSKEKLTGAASVVYREVPDPAAGITCPDPAWEVPRERDEDPDFRKYCL